ncbi:TatD family hydrolase [Bacteroides sp. OttesenSCG-928-D19]|nr:TatD family hydrolase [Bacteroides sp. OttesenSCG-928-D19]
MFVDSHSHLYLEEFSDDLFQVINRAREAGITHILLPNIDSTTTESMLKVSDTYSGYCFPMMGLHPTSVDKSYKEELAIVEQELKSNDLYIGVGEIGLDLYWDKTYMKEQVHAFDYQLQLALKHELPVVIHSREAFDLLYQTMLPYKDTALKGIFHSFTGTIEEAEKLLSFDHFVLGINGVVTFKNSSLPQVLCDIPLNKLVLETDAPYLTPTPYRGKRNESAYLKYTLHKVAHIYNETPEAVLSATSKNIRKLFSKLK